MSLAIQVLGLGKQFKAWNRKSTTVKRALLDMFKPAQDTVDGHVALRDINLEIKKGESVGLIGPNGSGKSTLFKCLVGVYYPTQGRVFVNGKLAAVIELTSGFHQELSGRENIFLNASLYGLSPKMVDDRLETILDFADIGEHIHEPVRTYSSGMKSRLAFALAIHVDADVILFDEVLAVGDRDFQKKCLARVNALRDAGKTIVLVSHNLEDVRNLCQRTLWLQGGKIEMDGPTHEVLEAYDRDTP